MRNIVVSVLLLQIGGREERKNGYIDGGEGGGVRVCFGFEVSRSEVHALRREPKRGRKQWKNCGVSAVFFPLCRRE